MGNTIGNAANGQGALGFLPGIVQNILAGQDYQNADAQTRIANMLVTGGLAAAGQYPAAVAARSAAGTENAALSPGGRAAVDVTSKKALAAQGNIEKAETAYADAVHGGDPTQIAITGAARRRALGIPLGPGDIAGEAAAGARAATMQPGVDTTGVTTSSGPRGLTVGGIRPSTLSTSLPGQPGAPEAPAATAPPGTVSAPENPNPLPGPTSAMLRSPADVQTVAKGDAVQGGIPGVSIVRDPNGVEHARAMVGENPDGSIVWRDVGGPELQQLQKEASARAESARKELQTATAKAETGLAVAQGVFAHLNGLVDGAFPKASHGPGESILSTDPLQNPALYTMHQWYRFNTPFTTADTDKAQLFATRATEGLAMTGAALGMRPGPRTIEALKATIYSPGDTQEQVHAKLANIMGYREAELHAFFADRMLDTAPAQGGALPLAGSSQQMPVQPGQPGYPTVGAKSRNQGAPLATPPKSPSPTAQSKREEEAKQLQNLTNALAERQRRLQARPQ